jgi:hypothetical protein
MKTTRLITKEIAKCAIVVKENAISSEKSFSIMLLQWGRPWNA